MTYLKEFYTSIKTPVYDKESDLLKFKSKSFINIALVDKDSAKSMTDSDKNEMIMDRLHGHIDAIQKKKRKINFSNVCKCEDGSVAHSVLVEGAPGVGKTTLSFRVVQAMGQRRDPARVGSCGYYQATRPEDEESTNYQ